MRVISATTIRPPSSSSDDFPVWGIIALIIAGIAIIGVAAGVLWGVSLLMLLLLLLFTKRASYMYIAYIIDSNLAMVWVSYSCMHWYPTTGAS